MGPPWGAFCQITLTSCLYPVKLCHLTRQTVSKADLIYNVQSVIMSNLTNIVLLIIIFVQKLNESEAEVKWQLIIVSLTRNSAVAKRPHAAFYWKFCCHSVTEGHWKWHRYIDRCSHTTSYSSLSSIVTMAISCIVSEIKRDVDRKSRFLSRVSTLTRDTDIALLCLFVPPSVRPSVCLSVTFRYQIKTA